MRADEQVRKRTGIQIVNRHFPKIQRKVGEHGGADPFIELRKLFIEPLTRQDIGAETMVVLRQRVQQYGVHVIPDAKGEQPQIVGSGRCQVGQNLVNLDHIHRREAIGHKEQVSRPVALDRRHSIQQRAVDICAADGSLPANPGSSPLGLGCGNHLWCKTVYSGAEGKDVKAVFRVKPVQNIACCFLGLVNFLALHAA